MNRRNFLKAGTLIFAGTLSSFYSYSNVKNNTLTKINDNTLTFFSTGDQIILDKNGLILKLNDGKIIKKVSLINNYLSGFSDSMINRQVEADEFTKIYFNKVVYTRSHKSLKDLIGSEIIVLFDNYGKASKSIDSLGETIDFYYDENGNKIKTKISSVEASK